MTRRHFGLVLVAILLVALVARLVVVSASEDFRPRGDATDYKRHAQSIADGTGYPPSDIAGEGGPSAFRPPLYPYFLAGAYELTGGGPTEARYAQAGVGAATVALVAVVAWQLWGVAVALTAAGLAALYPPLLLVDTSLLSETLFLPLVLGALAAVLWARRSEHRVRWALLAGALTGLATLTRGNAPVLLLPLAIGLWGERPRLSRAALGPPLAMLAAFALAVAPWTLRNWVVMDAFVPVSTLAGYTLAGTYNDAARMASEFPAAWRPTVPEDSSYARLLARPDLNEVELERELRAEVLEYVRDHPGYVAEVGFWNTVRLLQLDGREYARIGTTEAGFSTRFADAATYSWWAVLVLSLAGVFTVAARRAPVFVWLVPLVLASVVFVAAPIRMRAPLEAFFVMLAALALITARERLVEWGRIRAGP
jgi:4-amino-4-deoxy-L-arabinose transferase-like glycosyltransferase